jgi:hypothetical protein
MTTTITKRPARRSAVPAVALVVAVAVVLAVAAAALLVGW